MAKPKVHTGNIVVKEDETRVIDFEYVSGDVKLRNGGTLIANELISVRGYVFLSSDVVFRAKKLQGVGGGVIDCGCREFIAPNYIAKKATIILK